MDGDPLHAPAPEVEAMTEPHAHLFGPLLGRRLLMAGGAGLLIVLLGWFLDREAAAGGLLVAALYGLGLCIGGLAFVVFGHILRAGWSVAFRRVPEALAGALPVAAVITLVALLLALPLYEWNHTDVVEQDTLLQHKAPWLNVAGFVIRAVLFLAIWTAFSVVIRRLSRHQDKVGGTGATQRSLMISAVFLVVFGLTWTLASFDWTMSLEPHWFSTVYAVYCFISAFLSAVAMIVILALLLERAGPLRGVLRTEHLHDLGKVLVAFTTFWAYIWFCQYMLIWYSNIPEETAYYVRRTSGGWQSLFFASLFVTWVIPFLALLPRPAKRSRSHMLRIALLLLFGRWLDLHLLVMPAVAPDNPWAIWWALPALVGVLSLVGWATLRAFGAARAVPERDPFLGESLGYHV